MLAGPTGWLWGMTVFKTIRHGVAIFAVLALTACGGGAELGDGSGSTTGSTTGGSTEPDVATLTLLASAPQLSSNASAVASGVTLTAIVKDANNNVVPGVTVQFGTPDSAEINVSNPATTDTNGRATAVVTTGGDPQNRTIHVTATAGSLHTVSNIDVVGTSLSISGSSSTQISVDTPYTVLLTDSAGNGIAGKTISVTTDSGNTVTPVAPVTNAAGQVTVTLNATKASSTLTATALGLTATKAVTVSTDQFTFTSPAAATEVNLGASKAVKLRWLRSGTAVPDGTVIDFTATRGTLLAASATTTGGVATVNIKSSEAGFSEITASSAAFSKPSASLAIEFVATTPNMLDVQASPAVLATNQTSEISAIVRDPDNNLVKNATVDFSLSDLTGGVLSSASAVTNSQGLAKVTYTATSQASASQNVVVTGKVRGTSITDTAMLTVGARAVSITLGTGADITSKNISTYQDPWTVLINDSAGNPVTDAEFTLSIIPLEFRKGTRSGSVLECDNEDVNLNDIIEPGEDKDGDGILEPGRVATVPSTVTLDSDGTGQFFVTYPKEFGEFVKVKIVGVAHVAGTETTESRAFWLRIAETDAPHLPDESPYGTVLDCADPN
ncbi:Ig-like domain-containing protein [Solimonas terrae]|uniref:Big-1 domain-containing protein n=1 Tax=Solimonas terrae TaxID=1396819 RepID=A0A6M2BQ01_9GAMM|nr:Ig-like domain-containing protein [Solimonas terrae]NGY04169.1 hypothetical protein [Solimonas terrae]